MTLRDVRDPAYAEAQRLQERIGFFDLHVDSIIAQRFFGYDLCKCHGAGFRGQPLFWHADIPRMRQAGYASACMGIHYFPWESEGGWQEANRQMDYLDSIARDGCLRVYNPFDWRKARELGKLALAPGVEGAHILNGRLDRVADLARRGVAYLTLAHFSRNCAVVPSMGLSGRKGGLTSFGRNLVHELNRYGIVVDVAHVNTQGVLDICAESRSPVLCSHCGVKGVHNVPRNISDAEIKAIAALDGAIGIMFAPIFLRGKLKADSSAILDHIEYIIQKVGIRYVALGSDYDGWLPSIPSDHRDCRGIVRITSGLQKRGYTERDIGLILRDNAIRVFENAWNLRDRR